MKQHLIAAILVMWGCAAGLFAAEEPWLVYAAAKIGTAPVIDGHLDDPCWQGLERTRPLTFIGGAPAAVTTTGMACWNDRNLYLAMVCMEPLMTVIEQKKAAGKIHPYDESVEIFMDAAHDNFNYFQFRMDIMGNRDTHERINLDRTLDKRWSGAVAVDHDQWTVEMTIPWDLLTKGRPDAKTIWGLNLNRNRAAGAEAEYLCWSDTQGGFHKPDRFGHLVFFPYPVFLWSYFTAIFRSVYDEMDSMTGQGRPMAPQTGTKFAAIKEGNEQFLKSLETATIARGQDAAVPYARGLELQRKLAPLENELLLQAVKNLATASGTKP